MKMTGGPYRSPVEQTREIAPAKLTWTALRILRAMVRLRRRVTAPLDADGSVDRRNLRASRHFLTVATLLLAAQAVLQIAAALLYAWSRP